MNLQRERRTRRVVRAVCLVLAVVFSLGGPLPVWVARLVPGLSPLTVFSVTLARGGWLNSLVWMIPPSVVLLIAVKRGRWFCHWMCPVGTLHALVPKAGKVRRVVIKPINAVLFWAVLTGSLLGLPLYHVLDPLTCFARVAPWLRGSFTPANIFLGLLLPVFLVISALQPMAWCRHVCPLGYLFQRVHIRPRGGGVGLDVERRRLLGGIVFGALPAALLPGVSARAAEAQPLPLLPPGATTPQNFARDCSRCHACVQACPTGILSIGWPGNRNALAWFHPTMIPEQGVCSDTCRACGQVCPTGAIQTLSLPAKLARQIGIARVRREACLAWNQGVACTVCSVKCPFDAIAQSRSEDWISRPVVMPERCTGCGYCEHFCPAVDNAGRAIVVEGVAEQGPVCPSNTGKKQAGELS